MTVAQGQSEESPVATAACLVHKSVATGCTVAISSRFDVQTILIQGYSAIDLRRFCKLADSKYRCDVFDLLHNSVT